MVFCHVAHSPDLWAFAGGFMLVLLGLSSRHER
jgi:hypothetical protein